MKTLREILDSYEGFMLSTPKDIHLKKYLNKDQALKEIDACYQSQDDDDCIHNCVEIGELKAEIERLKSKVPKKKEICNCPAHRAYNQAIDDFHKEG